VLDAESWAAGAVRSRVTTSARDDRSEGEREAERTGGGGRLRSHTCRAGASTFIAAFGIAAVAVTITAGAGSLVAVTTAGGMSAMTRSPLVTGTSAPIARRPERPTPAGVTSTPRPLTV